jgi:hypothetical protein
VAAVPGRAHAQFGLPHLCHTAFSALRRKLPTWEITPKAFVRDFSDRLRACAHDEFSTSPCRGQVHEDRSGFAGLIAPDG